MARTAFLVPLATALGCGSPADVSASAQPREIQVVPGAYLAFDQPLVPLTEGGDLPLRLAPQGGHWAFVSARVRGYTGTVMSVGVSVLDAESGALRFAERRKGAVVASPSDPHAVEPALDLRGAIVHVPICPVEVPPGLFAQRVRLEVEVGGTETGHASLTVTPACSAGTSGERAVCECECAPGDDPSKCF